MKDFSTKAYSKESIKKKPSRFLEELDDFEEFAFHESDNKRRSMDKKRAIKDKRVSLRDNSSSSAE